MADLSRINCSLCFAFCTLNILLYISGNITYNNPNLIALPQFNSSFSCKAFNSFSFALLGY